MADTNDQSLEPVSHEQLNYLWDEYKYRHGLCWKAVYKIVAVVVVLGVLPYARPELAKPLGSWMLIPPLTGTLFAVFGMFVVRNELQLFAKTKVAYHSLANRFLYTVLKTSSRLSSADIKALVRDDVTPSNARWTLFDKYVHLLIIILFLLSLGNTLLLAFSWIPNHAE